MMFWLLHRRKVIAAAAVLLLAATAYKFRGTTLSTRITNRAMLVGQYVVVFPVCESNTFSGVKEYFPTPETGQAQHC
jgi:hypothetical protein